LRLKGANRIEKLVKRLLRFEHVSCLPLRP
jgi:hypothetical protein